MKAGLAYFALSMSALGASFGASESDLAEMQSSIDELKGEIPSEIEDDFTTYANALEEYANAMTGTDMADIMSGVRRLPRRPRRSSTRPRSSRPRRTSTSTAAETCPSSGSSSSSQWS